MSLSNASQAIHSFNNVFLIFTSFQTSPKERRKQFRKIRRSQSMDFEDTEEYLMNQLLFLFQLILQEGHESRLFKLLSDSDIQVYSHKNCQYFTFKIQSGVRPEDMRQSGHRGI